MVTVDARVRDWVDGVANVALGALTIARPYQPIQVSASTYYIVMMGDLNGDPRVWFQKSTDTKVTWSSPTQLEDVDRGSALTGRWGVCFDNWTNGDTDGIIHVVIYDSLTADFLWYGIDTSDDSIAGPTTLSASIAAPVTVSVVKDRGGWIQAGYTRVVSGGNGGHHFISDDGGASFAQFDGPDQGEATASSDQIIYMPGIETDNHDILCMYWDTSVDEITVKTWDDSAETWSESSAVFGESMDSSGSDILWGAVSRHSDDHTILVARNSFAGADILSADITNGGSIDTSTIQPALVDESNIIGVALAIDQNDDSLYCFIVVGTDSTARKADIKYTKSTDDGVNWASLVTVNNNLANSASHLWVSLSVSNIGVPGAFWRVPNFERVMCDGAVTDSVGSAGSFPVGTGPLIEDIAIMTRGTTNAITIERPRGCEVDDLLLLIVECGDSGGTMNIDTPTGWTVLFEDTDTGFRNAGMVAWKFVVSLEADDYDLTAVSGGSMEKAIIARISNPHPEVGLHPVTLINTDTSNGRDVPAITTTKPDSLVVRGHLSTAGLWSNPDSNHVYGVAINGPGANSAAVGIASFAAGAPQTLVEDTDAIGGLLAWGTGFSLIVTNPDGQGAAGGIAGKLALMEIL